MTDVNAENKRHHSEETKKKISNSSKGKVVSIETRRKLSESGRGKSPSLETREKISESKKKLWENSEYRSAMEKISADPENRRKISEANTGKIFSLEHRRKLSENKKGENNPGWKGGGYNMYHQSAWKLFGKSHCEICKMDLMSYRKKFKNRFHMHCVSGDYKILFPENWLTVCYGCHRKLDFNSKGRLVKTSTAD